MSYCRFSDGDVYLLPYVNGGILCCACWLNDRDNNIFYSRKEVIAHLDKHREAGFEVPEYAYDRLRKEIKELGDKVEAIDYEEDW